MPLTVHPFSPHVTRALEQQFILSHPTPEAWNDDRKIFNYICWHLNQLGCKHVVVEDDYIDRDYSEDYSAFYSTTFFDTGKSCVRLHFFSHLSRRSQKALTSEGSIPQIRAATKKLQDAYLGFLVILPIPKSNIGRTVIAPRPGRYSEHYCTSYATTKVNLGGIPLAAHGAPFIQQDGHVAVCASAAIWVVSRVMQLLYNFQRFSLSRITTAANKHLHLNREFPAIRGLTLDQIMSGFFELGFTPICYNRESVQAPTKWDPKEIIYKYIESNLPVIAIIRGSHACVIVGHDFHPSKKVADGGQLVSSSELINCFLVQDDMLGPYILMPEWHSITPGSTKFTLGKPSESEFSPFKDTPNLFTPYSIRDITSIIIPTFKKIYLEGQQIETLIRDTIEGQSSILRSVYLEAMTERRRPSISNMLKVNAKTRAGRFEKILRNGTEKIFYRTRFMLSNHFKEDYLLRKPFVPEGLALQYSQMHFPRYLWVAELCLEEAIRTEECGTSQNGRTIIGEILIDPTGPDDPGSIISVHFPGCLLVNSFYDPELENVEMIVLYPITDDAPYMSFDRSRLTVAQ